MASGSMLHSDARPCSFTHTSFTQILIQASLQGEKHAVWPVASAQQAAKSSRPASCTPPGRGPLTRRMSSRKALRHACAYLSSNDCPGMFPFAAVSAHACHLLYQAHAHLCALLTPQAQKLPTCIERCALGAMRTHGVKVITSSGPRFHAPAGHTHVDLQLQLLPAL